MIELQKVSILQRMIGMVGLTISVLLIIFFSDFLVPVLSYLEQLSPDHELSTLSIILVNTLFISLITVAFVFSLLLFLGISEQLTSIISHKSVMFVNRFINFDQMRAFIFNDRINTYKNFALWAFFISVFVGTLLHLNVIYFGIPPYEGTMEKVSTIVLLLALVFVFLSLFYIKRTMLPYTSQKKLIIGLLVGSGVVFLMFGEEISWGQRIFSWKSTGVFDEYNYQKETNLHNFLNPILDIVYPIVGLSSFIFLLMARLFPARGASYLSNLFYPHPSLFFLLLLMAGASFYGKSELYESLLSLFLFFYGLRIWLCLRNPRTKNDW